MWRALGALGAVTRGLAASLTVRSLMVVTATVATAADIRFKYMTPFKSI